ncbi:MAG: SAM-dependent methyltransferase, partial [Erysipelotrichaceae bacterium]|nr:SAM-dependent methyltransferase [Erysipelotrichaceae bacterium]
RLKKIAEMIDDNKVVFYVGSDHALLPCFLLEEGRCQKVYAGEVAEGPLDKVKQAVDKYGYEGRLIPVYSDGLQNAPDDVEVVVIAGMGYYTIRHILDDCDIAKYDYFIVQSNTDVDLLRQYLADHGYRIIDEKVIHDGFYYQIIKFDAKEKREYTPMEIKYGPVNIARMDETFKEYLEDLKKRLERINERANKEEYRQIIREIDDLLVYNLYH